MSAYSNAQLNNFSFTGNQAALAKTKDMGFGVAAERRFMMEENTVYAFAITLPTKSLGNFGVSLNASGFSDFREQKIGLAYGRSLGSKVDIGAQFNYYGYKIPSYNNANAINFEAGAIMHVLPKVNVGVHVYNPVGGTLNKTTDEKLASAYKLGIGYDASPALYLSSEIIKEEDKTVSVNGGIQYQFKKQFFAKAGFISETGSAYGGFGVGYHNIRLDLAAGYHPQLGISPALMLIYGFKKTKE